MDLRCHGGDVRARGIRMSRAAPLPYRPAIARSRRVLATGLRAALGRARITPYSGEFRATLLLRAPRQRLDVQTSRVFPFDLSSKPYRLAPPLTAGPLHSIKDPFIHPKPPAPTTQATRPTTQP